MMAYAQAATRSFSPSWVGKRPRMRRLLVASWGRMTQAETLEPARLNALVLEVAGNRDRGAFETLFTHFAPRIKAYLLKLGAGSGLADDLAQEAMLTLWRKAALFDPGKASAATWIFTIARNLRIDAIRRERRPDFDPDDPALAPDEEKPADARMIQDDDETKLRSAMRDLSPEQAQVVQMSFFADKPHSQIAAELGLPLGTVKSRLRLAMARIRVSMANIGGGAE
jgi:RNA polymerase sigma factor (sigma-70 family)